MSQCARSLPTGRRSKDAGSVSVSLARQPGGTRDGSRSSSGASTKPRSDILGCGTTRSGSETRTSSTKRMSTSSVRGPLRTVRTRPASSSSPRRPRGAGAGQARSRAARRSSGTCLGLPVRRAAPSRRPVRPEGRDRYPRRPRTASSRYPMRSPTFEPRARKASVLKPARRGVRAVSALLPMPCPRRPEVGACGLRP